MSLSGIGHELCTYRFPLLRISCRIFQRIKNQHCSRYVTFLYGMEFLLQIIGPASFASQSIFAIGQLCQSLQQCSSRTFLVLPRKETRKAVRGNGPSQLIARGVSSR